MTITPAMEMTTVINAQIAAQVAVEAVANEPEAFNRVTIEAVRANAQDNNLSEYYMELIRYV